jgi:hypothetical protein
MKKESERKSAKRGHCPASTRRTSVWRNFLTLGGKLRWACVPVLSFTLLVGHVGSALAVSNSEELGEFGGIRGTAAGQLSFPFDMASSPTNGHIYVVGLGPSGNARIDEFTPWGEFVKAFGWDVAPGAVNEQQEVRIRATNGNFKLEFEGAATGDIPFGAPANESEGSGSVEAVLNALPTIGGAGGAVSVRGAPGTTNGTTPYVYVVAFRGSLAATNVGALTAVDGSTPLSGGSPSTTLEAATRADGSPGSSGLGACTTESGCQAGSEGTGAGQFQSALSVAVAPDGSIYVRESDSTNRRVQKFSPAGKFLLSIGGEVDKTTGANICTAASGDECGAGKLGTAAGEFSKGFGVTVGPDGTVFVGDAERIQRFSPQGVFEASLAVPGEVVRILESGPDGSRLYALYEGEGAAAKDNVRELDPATGSVLGALPADDPKALAVNSDGEVFVSIEAATPRVLQFAADGTPLEPPACCGPKAGRDIRGVGATAAAGLLVSEAGLSPASATVRQYGPPPVAFEAPPQVPPTIARQFASSVGQHQATIKAWVNPHFWTDTHLYVEYGTGECSAGDCPLVEPAAPGVLLTSSVAGSAVLSPGIEIGNLEPNTTYHFRVVAESSGGGPVKGVENAEGIFTTRPQTSVTTCPNEVFRVGPSVGLPGCRAYEMVSPVDKSGADIKSLANNIGYSTALSQSSPSGERFTYTSQGAFGNPAAAPYANQYLAARSTSGWSSAALAPPQGNAESQSTGFEAVLENEFKAFSPDLCYGWLSVAPESPLDSEEGVGFPGFYRKNNCQAGFQTLIASAELRGEMELQGVTSDGSSAILRVVRKLTPEAAEGVSQTYFTEPGGLKLVCVLPTGAPYAGPCSGGNSPELSEFIFGYSNHVANVTHALAADGSGVYWTAVTNESGPLVGSGHIYLRLNPADPQSAAGCEANHACTVKVSETKSAAAARFVMASPDGRKALYEFVEGTLAGNLYEFDAESGTSTLVARKALGVAGAAEDLSSIYFVSEEKIAGTAGATSGARNLYVSQEGAATFIAKLSAMDVHSAGVTVEFSASNVDPWPVNHAAIASPDGKKLAFISTEQLTDYDNTDVSSPTACGSAAGTCDSEVYVYEEGSSGPICVSCNPTGSPPSGRETELVVAAAIRLPTAAALPLAKNQLYRPHVFGTSGQLFFESFDQLTARDTNSSNDVYEWLPAEAASTCAELKAEMFVPAAHGCISLISGGGSGSGDTEFLDASPDGSNVFFTTAESLVPQDPGQIDVYDAHEGGGFAPTVKPQVCEGETCQQVGPPAVSAGVSSGARGPGNPPQKRCKKGTKRVVEHGRPSCVRPKKHHKRHPKKKHHGKPRHGAKRTSKNHGGAR